MVCTRIRKPALPNLPVLSLTTLCATHVANEFNARTG